MKPGGKPFRTAATDELSFDMRLATIFIQKVILSLCVATAFLVPAQATTIQKFTFAEMVELSALIIEGEVLSITPMQSGDLIISRVVFQVDDVLKGIDPGAYIELDFLGGQDQGKDIKVSGQDIPEVGERGFYFIESLDGHSVNPLVGWSQGHFRIHKGPKGEEYLETDIQQEVVDLTQNKNAVLAAKLRQMKFSSKLVEDAWFTPLLPQELRDAVRGQLD